MQSILILAADSSARLIYILNELLVRRLGVDYKITNSEDYFLKSNSARINYGNTIIEGCINIPATNLLYSEGLKQPAIEVTSDKRWQFTFFNKPYENIPDVKITTHWLHFDVLAAAFYLLSRYEEYNTHTVDKHGRFDYKKSVAFNHGFLNLPLVDIWLDKAKQILTDFYPALVTKTSNYQQTVTVDVDRIYKYKGLSRFGLLKKQLAHRLLGRKEALQQLKAYKQNQNDPYDTFKNLAAHQHQMVFFWLLSSNKHKLDKNLPVANAAYQVVKNLQANHIRHGLHPSYYAAANKKALKTECLNFKTLFGVEPTLARWHFLKINLPKSYNWLLENGIKEDWSMAYADMPGFRASTAFPFNFFNLQTNQETDLLVQPIALMDVSLKNGLQLTPQNAINLINKYKATIKQVNGKFIAIWHNSSFDETEGWQGWEAVFKALTN